VTSGMLDDFTGVRDPREVVGVGARNGHCDSRLKRCRDLGEVGS
jgi:hypothetical protein